MRTLFWENNVHWVNFIKSLKSKDVIDLKIWVGAHNLADYHVHSFDYCNLPDYHFYPIPKNTRDKLFRHFPTFIETYCRNYRPDIQNVYANKNYHDYLDIINILSNHFYKILIENEIQLVMMNRMPHLGSDFLMLVLARSLGIKTLIFQQFSVISDRFFYMYSYDDFGRFNEIQPLDINLPDTHLKPAFRHDWFYMKKNYKTVHRDPFAMNRFKDGKSLRHSFPNIDPYADELELAYAKEVVERERMYNSDLELSVSRNCNHDANFVYFPLHVQPELTTSLNGGKYVDQLLVLELLSEIIPSDWFIYAKENPKQNYFMRGKWFFKRLNAIANLKILPSDYDTVKLIETSKFVATVSGTVGWEALTGGKNVLVFGKPWYRSMPGVFTYNPRININSILNYRFKHETLEEAFRQLIRKTGEGYTVLGHNISEEDFNSAENISKVTESIVQILENIT